MNLLKVVCLLESVEISKMEWDKNMASIFVILFVCFYSDSSTLPLFMLFHNDERKKQFDYDKY